MKKLSMFFFLFIIIILIWYGESRKFVYVDNGEYITVWKTYNDICYIIPDKYYGIVKPSKNYIESSNSNILSIYITKDLPNSVIYVSTQDLKVINNYKNEFNFYDYNKDAVKFGSLIYISDANKNKNIKDNVKLISLYIGENYATDKDGKKIF